MLFVTYYSGALKGDCNLNILSMNLSFEWKSKIFKISVVQGKKKEELTKEN